MSKQAAMEKALALIERTPDSTSKYVDETLQEIVDLLSLPSASVVVGNRVDLADIVATRIFTDNLRAMALPSSDATEGDLIAWADGLRAIAERAQEAGVILNQAGQVRRAYQKAAQT